MSYDKSHFENPFLYPKLASFNPLRFMIKVILVAFLLAQATAIHAQSRYGNYTAPLTLMTPHENWEQRRQNKFLEMQLLSEIAWEKRKQQFFNELLATQLAYKRDPSATLPKRSTNGFVTTQIRYKNVKTGYEADYTLGVRLTDYRVDAILFSDGGTLHDGPNNSDYAYGSLIGSDKFVVVVLYRNGTQTVFSIPFQEGIID